MALNKVVAEDLTASITDIAESLRHMTGTTGKYTFIPGSTNDIADTLGQITPRTSSDLAVNGPNVYAPAGYYSAQASAQVATGSSTVSGGGLTSGSGSVSATGTNITLTEVPSEPSSGTYIEVTGYGTVNRAAITKSQSAGFISGGTSTVSSSTSKTSNIATRYYTIDVAGTEYLHGVYQFVTAPEADYLPDSSWSTGTSASSLVFGWTGGTTGGAGTVYENETTGISVYYSSNYGLYIKYGSKVAYSNTTYGNIVSYTGWQALDGTGTQCRTIIIASPQAFNTDDTFYKWFSSNTTRIGDWTGGGGSGTSIETGTVTINAYGPDPHGYSGDTDFYYTAFENGAIVAKHTSSNAVNSVTLNNVVVNSYLTYNCVGGIALSPTSGASFIVDINFTGSQMSQIFEITGTSASFSTYTDCCFEGTSQILLADNTTKNLSEISIGEKLITYNEQTGINEINEVTALGTAPVNHNTIIILEDNTLIQMNKYHPLWTEDGWKSIVKHRNLPKLTEADKLMNNNGDYVAIKSIEEIEINTATYYTIKVANNNNFYVNGYLAQGKDKD